jgi:uncharacterized protein
MKGQPMKIIDGQELYAYIISGAKNVVVNEVNLNKINVFPVPDGDTGTNLSLTMNMIIQGANKLNGVGEQSHHIASLALNNAYGNSGMIFAQYFHGFAQAFSDKATISAQELVKGFSSGFEKAFSSVSQPKEGTVLTVMNLWSQSWEKHMSDNFENVFEDVLKQLKQGVEDTKQQLKILKDNNVVDAGAMAFFYFMEGVLRFIKTRNLDDINFEAATLELVDEIMMSAEVGDYRYCAQYLVNTTTSPNEFQNILQGVGDSCVVNGMDGVVSIHIHTNEPQEIMKTCVSLGHVISHKVDDMWLQANMIHKPISKTAIITDSIADIPKSLADSQHCVVFPLNIIIDSVVYMDKITMTSSDFYQHMDDYTLNPSSSQPTVSSVERLFKSVLQHYDEVIGIFVSSQMSGTYNTMQKALGNLNLEGKKVKLIDSKANSIAQGLVVMKALELKEAGHTFEEIVSQLEDIIERVKIYVSVKDLKYMIKGGRVSKVTGMVLSKLKLQPVISIDSTGKGIIPYKSFSQKSAVKSILKALKKDHQEFGVERYALVYADNPHDLDDFQTQIKSILNLDPDYIESISPIVGLNAGKGAFAIGYITKKEVRKT